MKINWAIAQSIIKQIIICGCCLLLAACNSSNLDESSLISAQVLRIVSGQTVTITQTEPNRPTKVRIIGIDAPDLRQYPWGKAAQQKLTELLESSPTVQLELETDTPDNFDRLLAHLWHNGTLVSEELIESGFVLANTQYPHKYSQRLAAAQEYARLLGNGIWNPQQPLRQTPKQFRSQLTAK